MHSQKIWVYFIRVFVYDKEVDFKWNLIIVYGDAHLQGKAAFLAELARICHDNTHPGRISEDVNLIRNFDKENKPFGKLFTCNHLVNYILNMV